MTKLLKDIHRHTLCRSLMSVAAYSVLLFTAISCAQDMPSTPQQEQIPISMSASAVESMESTRALITDDNGLQEVGFGVYATKKVASNNPVLVFDNEKVYYSSVWKYDNTKYWDRTATYNFVAYAPYSVSVSASTSYALSTNTLTIKDIPYWQTINKDVTDYLVANSSGSADYYLTQQQTSTAVNFNFSHILSQLVINVVKDANLTNTEYKVKKIEYINVPASEGKANCTYSSPSSTPSFSEISITSSSSNPSSVSMLTGEMVVTLADANDIITLPHLVVPFTLSDKKVQVEVTYTVAGTERNKTVDTGITQLEAGKRYELTLTFKGADIVPSLSIEPWTDVSVDEDPKYNW